MEGKPRGTGVPAKNLISSMTYFFSTSSGDGQESGRKRLGDWTNERGVHHALPEGDILYYRSKSVDSVRGRDRECWKEYTELPSHVAKRKRCEPVQKDVIRPIRS